MSIVTGNCIKVLNGHNYSVSSVAVTPDGSKIVSYSGDESIKIWDINTGNCLNTIEKYNESIRSLAITPDGAKIVYTTSNAVKILDITTGAYLRKFDFYEKHDSRHPRFNSIAITPDGTKIFSSFSIMDNRSPWDTSYSIEVFGNSKEKMFSEYL